jgi:hypothetical protein
MRSTSRAPLATALALGALAAAAPAAGAATVTRYVAGTRSSYDYTLTSKLPSGLRVLVSKSEGSLGFRRAKRTVVIAQQCTSSSETDPTGVEVVKDEASDPKVALHKIATGVYKAGKQYWIVVRGGSCLRFSRRAGGSAALLRSLALRTKAQLGRTGPVGASDPDGLALVRRTRRAAADSPRIASHAEGGICTGVGLACTAVRRPGSAVVQADFDSVAHYSHVTATLPSIGTFRIVTRDKSVFISSGADGCWIGPVPTSVVGSQALVSATDFALPLTSWRLRYSKPAPQPDGMTTIGFRGYWSRGTAIVDGSGRLVGMQSVERTDPGMAISGTTTQTYPDAIQQVTTEPSCPSSGG